MCRDLKGPALNDNDEAEQDALFQIEGPDDDGCVWACSNEGREVWCRNLGPQAGEAQAVGAKPGTARSSKRCVTPYGRRPISRRRPGTPNPRAGRR